VRKDILTLTIATLSILDLSGTIIRGTPKDS
jgi:hypothetical protein